jgi:hypothetical protein
LEVQIKLPGTRLTKPTKRLGSLTQIQLPDSLLMQHLLSCFTPRSVGNVVLRIWTVVRVSQIGFGNGFVRLIERRAKDVFDT